MHASCELATPMFRRLTNNLIYDKVFSCWSAHPLDQRLDNVRLFTNTSSFGDAVLESSRTSPYRSGPLEFYR